MRILKFLLALILSICWLFWGNRSIGPVPAIGPLFDPVKGFWFQAEDVSDKKQFINLPEYLIKDSINIELDERLVPHIIAHNDHDLYAAQGYIHAYYRLWQMDMQVRAAAGRLSEVVGEKTLDIDRNQRRKGMIWAAEKALQKMENDPRTKTALDAYTLGVNTYISELQQKDYPLEYKLMGFIPEPWTNLKCALLLKYMADDLTGKVDDIALSYVRTVLSSSEFEALFPDKIPGSDPVIPRTTVFSKASLQIPTQPFGKIWADLTPAPQTADATLTPAADAGLGSNNWAIGPSKTTDGSTLLCNDPHLGLNLPAIWYEIQLQAPGINCYGASIPGAPGIVIGFNDSLSWGMTNNYRDVKDYYEITFAEDPQFYVFDGAQQPFDLRYETIGIKGQSQKFIDTVRYTIHGPLQYDKSFPEPSGSKANLAMSWMAHRPSNELLSIYLINRANNLQQFELGIQHFECPAQNFVYSDRQGNIAIWGQGRFINKWKNQGKFVMRGDISATLWGDTIPMNENPKAVNPPIQYLASANQNVSDNSYPYWYNGDFTEFRSWAIHYLIDQDTLAQTVKKMKALQNNNYSVLAATVCPLLDSFPLFTDTVSWRNPFQGWDYCYSAYSHHAVLFQYFWRAVRRASWEQKLGYLPGRLIPADEVTLQLLAAEDSEDFRTLTGQNRDSVLWKSIHIAIDSVQNLSKQRGVDTLPWYLYNNTTITHIARIPAFSYGPILTGGWKNAVNAVSETHGPSWRMIVQMKPAGVQAWISYPGGQSGNPGSKYFNNLLNNWAQGKYDAVHFLPSSINHQKR